MCVYKVDSYICFGLYRDMMMDANSQWKKLEDETGVELLMSVDYFENITNYSWSLDILLLQTWQTFIFWTWQQPWRKGVIFSISYQLLQTIRFQWGHWLHYSWGCPKLMWCLPWDPVQFFLCGQRGQQCRISKSRQGSACCHGKHMLLRVLYMTNITNTTGNGSKEWLCGQGQFSCDAHYPHQRLRSSHWQRCKIYSGDFTLCKFCDRLCRAMDQSDNGSIGMHPPSAACDGHCIVLEVYLLPQGWTHIWENWPERLWVRGDSFLRPSWAWISRNGQGKE